MDLRRSDAPALGRQMHPAGHPHWHTVVVTDSELDPKGDPAVPEPPSADEIARALRLAEPLRKLINPKVYGIENVPNRRALLVGNHTVMGMLDSPLMCAELWERGIIVRSLGTTPISRSRSGGMS